MTDELSPRYAGEIVATCASAIYHGAHTLVSIPGLIKRIINENLWSQYERTDGIQHFETFPEFIEKGLGTNFASLQHLCKDNPEALDILDLTVEASPGRFKKNVDNTNIIRRPSGTSSAYSIRRLRNLRPDLHKQVLIGQITSNQAMIQAGLRRKRVSVPADDPERAANALRRHYTKDQIKQIMDLLSHV